MFIKQHIAAFNKLEILLRICLNEIIYSNEIDFILR